MKSFCTFVLTITRDMKTLSNQAKTELAVKMVILDAIEKGHTNPSELINYMRSETFNKAVESYKSIINQRPFQTQQ